MLSLACFLLLGLLFLSHCIGNFISAWALREHCVAPEGMGGHSGKVAYLSRFGMSGMLLQLHRLQGLYRPLRFTWATLGCF